MQAKRGAFRRFAIGFLAIALLATAGVWSCSQKGGTGVDDDDDGTDHPPATVADLTVVTTTPGTVTLRWTAPHGGSPTMVAYAYDLRYAASAIVETNWNQATEVADEPAPLPAGMTQKMTVIGLPPDTTLCFALKTRGQGGLWSGLSNCPTATLPPVADVVIPDPELEALIRAILEKPTGPLRTSDLAGITAIEANHSGIDSLEGLQHCVALSVLNLRGNAVKDIAPLAGLVHLSTLDASDNQIQDLQPLAGLTRLVNLGLGDNAIRDLGPLHEMQGLNILYLDGNRIEEIASLAGCVRLNHLFLADNAIYDLDPLTGLIYLATLDLSRNAITDLGPLIANTGLDTGTEMWVVGNPLSEISRTEQIPALRARGAIVHDR